jgi:phenylalanyl-tRNA synthetase alpha chain
MDTKHFDAVKASLISQAKSSAEPRSIFRSPELKSLYSELAKLPSEDRRAFGQSLNQLKSELEAVVSELEAAALAADVTPLDITAPTDINQPLPTFMDATHGHKHPLMTELDIVAGIYRDMGFDVVESRQLDDDFHMFTSLNFPYGHPARDGYDTFRTAEDFIPPAHTSTMQHRVLVANRDKLEQPGGQIAVVVPGRVFRNEDVDATHEHTFYQCEGVFVSSDATLGQMLGVLQKFFEAYYGQSLRIKTQPAYFPFTEPSLEFLIEKPKTLGGKGDGWLELAGCGMIHPRVLEMAGIDPTEYRGFAWGGGIDRLVMMKYHLRDVRNFESGKLRFLEEF